MADENDGKAIRNSTVAAMWQDAQARIENVGVGSIVIVLLIYCHIYVPILYIPELALFYPPQKHSGIFFGFYCDCIRKINFLIRNT